MATLKQAWHVIRFVWEHPANSRHRGKSVCRAIAFQIRGRLGMRTLTTIGSRGLMWAELHTTAASKVLYANPPDWNEMQAWRRLLKPGDLFIDVGSNVGSYALWAADLGAQVIAIEPSSTTAQKLRQNVDLNDFPITVGQYGLAHEQGTMTLTQGKDAMNHLLASSDATGEEVPIDTLDNVLGDRYAAGVKVDVEGAELWVLQGARRALRERRIGALQLEWNAMSQRVLGESRASVAELLGEYGYRMMAPDRQGYLHPTTAPPESAEDLFAVAP